MKKHLAIVCGVYYPEASPTGVCVKRIVEVLADVYDIDIVCIASDGKDTSVIKQTENIHAVGCKRIELEAKSYGIKKIFFHAIGGLQIKTKLLGNLSWYRKAALHKLIEIHSERKLDVVFTVCSPFASHLAGIDMVERFPEIKHCGYTVDPYSTPCRIRPFFISRDKLVLIENKVLCNIGNLLVSEEVYENRSDLLLGLRNCTALPYMLPTFNMVEVNEKLCPTSGVDCVYAGRFYEDIRNPEFLLRVFAKLSDQNVRLHLFSVGCDEIIRQYEAKYSNIICHEQVSHELISTVYKQADILIGVGNTIAEFMPSKTFEYIAALKPIIFVNHATMTNKILDMHPEVIQISDASNVDEAAELVKDFCIQNENKQLDQDVVKKIYYKHSLDNIKKILLECTNDNN